MEIGNIKMVRIDPITNNIIGDGEDAIFTILQNITGLEQKYEKDFPTVGIYRQLSVSLIYDQEQMKFLADFHKKSSIDIFIIPYEDDYVSHLSRLAVRVEGKKGDLKMLRQSVQKRFLSKWCKVVDFHKRDCPTLFQDKINPKSMKELTDVLEFYKIKLPGVLI